MNQFVTRRQQDRIVLAARLLFVAAPLAAVLGLASCSLPQDPKGTLDRVRGDTLRVGVAENAPWVRRTSGAPAGLEADLVRRLAEELNAEIEWKEGMVEKHLEALEQYQLDLVAAGLTKRTPWRKTVALTHAYATVGEEQHVMAAPPGENAWLMRVEQFLHEQHSQLADSLKTPQ